MMKNNNVNIKIT